MEQKRKIELVGRKLTFAEAEEQDLFFWADKTPKERLAETERLRRMIWTHVLGYYPDKMEIVGRVRRQDETDDE